jgi:hypothetical protein
LTNNCKFIHELLDMKKIINGRRSIFGGSG